MDLPYDYCLHRDSSLVSAAKILVNFFDTDDTIETEEFYFDSIGNDPDMPNLWVKGINFQMIWSRDDPSRGAFSNRESDPNLALDIIKTVTDSYARSRG